MPEPDLLGLPIPAQNPLHLCINDAMASTRFTQWQMKQVLQHVRYSHVTAA